MVVSKNPKVDDYFAVGCGRCPLGGTPDCKVHNWVEYMQLLREILLDTALTEEHKWGVACYTYNDKNVLLLSAFKEYCSLSFFKGVLMEDPHNLLEQTGPNSQAARLIRITRIEDIQGREAIIKAYIENAIAVEDAGLKVDFKETSQFDFPDELVTIFEEDPNFEAAFNALTPGRQRGYLLHFSGAKQSATRIRRIEKYMPRIFEGKGMHDRD